MLNWDDPLTPLSTDKAEKAKPKTLLQSYAVSSALDGIDLSSVETAEKPAPANSADASVNQAVSAMAGMRQEQQSSTAAVSSDDKRVINGEGDINQLAPFKYPWAWEYFLNANKNHWTPLDINMAQDVHDYNHTLTPAEQHVYTNVLA